MVGTPESVTQRLVDIVTNLPVDPLLMRPQWPTMSADETIAAIRRLGRDVLPHLLLLEPTTHINGEMFG